MEVTELAFTAADMAALVYSLVFMGGVIAGWAFVQGLQQRL